VPCTNLRVPRFLVQRFASAIAGDRRNAADLRDLEIDAPGARAPSANFLSSFPPHPRSYQSTTNLETTRTSDHLTALLTRSRTPSPPTLTRTFARTHARTRTYAEVHVRDRRSTGDPTWPRVPEEPRRASRHSALSARSEVLAPVMITIGHSR